jgi:hypothetical protein
VPSPAARTIAYTDTQYLYTIKVPGRGLEPL